VGRCFAPTASLYPFEKLARDELGPKVFSFVTKAFDVVDPKADCLENFEAEKLHKRAAQYERMPRQFC
jgi:hypothetical protein